MTDCGHKYDVRISWIHQHLRDVLGVIQSDVFPSLSTVRGLIHSVPKCNVVSQTRFSRAHVNDVVVRRGNPDRADREIRLMVENWSPIHSAVSAFPETSCYSPEVINVWIIRQTRYCFDATSAKWPNQPPLQPIEQTFVHSL